MKMQSTVYDHPLCDRGEPERTRRCYASPSRRERAKAVTLCWGNPLILIIRQVGEHRRSLHNLRTPREARHTPSSAQVGIAEAVFDATVEI